MQNPCIDCPTVETCTDETRKTCPDLKHYCDECDWEMAQAEAEAEAEAEAAAYAQMEAEAETEENAMCDGCEYDGY